MKTEKQKSIEFFMPLKKVPTATHQQTKRRKDGRFYKPKNVKDAQAILKANLYQYVPKDPFEGPLRLVVKWCHGLNTTHQITGAWKTTRPDLDNAQKLIQDCMTDLHFWTDDAQVVSLTAEKFWSDVPGIYIYLEEVEP